MELCTTDHPTRFAVLDIPCTRIMAFSDMLEGATIKANSLPNCFVYELSEVELENFIRELEVIS